MSFTTRALIILTSLNLLDYLDRYLVASLGSLVKAEMGLSDRAFGFLGTAFFLVYLCASPIFGYLGDRWGRLRLMAGGAVLWSLATSLTFWVGSYPALLLARGAVGVGEASFGTLSPAYLADILPLGRRGRALGWFYLAIPVGSALAYLVGGLMGSHWGWRPAFLLAGLPGLAMAALVWRLPGIRPQAAAPTPPASIPLLGASWGLLKIPTFRWVSLGYGMVTFALGGLAFWMPHYLEISKGLSLAQANLLLFGFGGRGRLPGDPDRGLFGGPFYAPDPQGPALGQRPGYHPGAPPGGPGDLFPGPRPLCPGPGPGHLSAVYEPGGAHRRGGERRRGAAAGPGGGLEYRGHPPGG